MKNQLFSGLFTGLVATSTLVLATACGDDDDVGTATGGKSSSGGSVASGGINSKGGSGGSTSTGGSTSAGGKAATGGTNAGGASAGSGGADDAGGEAGSGGSSVFSARLRVLHLSPNAGNVDVFANKGDTPVVADLAFPEGTPYLSVPAATYDFDVSATGTSAEDAVLSIADLELEGGMSYTAVAYDNVTRIKALALADDYDGLAAGNIRVRAIHTAVGVGEVDIWNITDPGAPAPLYEDVAFGVAGDALDVPAGAYTIGIDVDDDANPDLAFELPALAAGVIVNLFAVADTNGVFLLAQLPDGSTARIDPRGPTAFLRVLHLSPDAPAVDVFANRGNTPLVSELAFPDGTGYLAVRAASYDIDVSASGTSAAQAVLSVNDLALEAGKFYTAVALDEVANLTALPLVDSYAGLGTGKIRVRAIHAAPGVGQVDIWNVPSTGAPAALWTNVNFGAAGAALDLDAGAYTIGVDVNNDAIPDLAFALPALDPGAAVNVFATNDDAGDVFLIAQLRDGTTARIDPE